jgi:hypothetical protein
MRKFTLMLLLAGVSSNAMAAEQAEPVEVGNGFGGDRIFAYPATIKKAGSDVKMWDLLNASTPQDLPGYSPYLSKVTQVQYACEDMRTRTLYTNFYSQKDGTGAKILFKNTSSLLDWQPVQPGTAQEALFKFACGKK